MNLTFIGLGYVGLAVSTCFANQGNRVLLIDKNKKKMNTLRKGILDVYEPNLQELFQKNIMLKRIYFSDNIEDSFYFSDIVFLTLPTFYHINYLIKIVNKIIIHNINFRHKVIINKSTSPIGTAFYIKSFLLKNRIYNIDFISNPEFLREGSALNDFMYPDRIILGMNNLKTIKILKKLYQNYIIRNIPFIITSENNAEIIKYISNAFLATKLSFINEISNLCDLLNINIHDILPGISLDHRIGNKYFIPGVGFGGSCLIKDIKYLLNLGKNLNFNFRILKSIYIFNRNQKYIFYKKILIYFKYSIYNKKIAVWGLSFKHNTDDIRNSPSIYLINKLLKYNCDITVFDPVSLFKVRDVFKNKIKYVLNMYDAIFNSDVLVICSSWLQFKHINFNVLLNRMKNIIIFDMINIVDVNTMMKLKFKFYYESFGNKIFNL